MAAKKIATKKAQPKAAPAPPKPKKTPAPKPPEPEEEAPEERSPRVAWNHHYNMFAKEGELLMEHLSRSPGAGLVRASDGVPFLGTRDECETHNKNLELRTIRALDTCPKDGILAFSLYLYTACNREISRILTAAGTTIARDQNIAVTPAGRKATFTTKKGLTFCGVLKKLDEDEMIILTPKRIS